MLATDHPMRDRWVDEQAAKEASRFGAQVKPYQGTARIPTGALVHLFATGADAARAREEWARAFPQLRVGRKVGRTIYRQLGPEPGDDDPIVGLMDTPELAALVVSAVNSSTGP